MTESFLPRQRGEHILTRQSKAPDGQDALDNSKLGFLCFELDSQEYGIDLNLIQKIVKPPPLTRVPRVPPHILGIISIRGSVVTLLDLRQLMDMEPSPHPKTARVLIVEMDNEPLGLLVDGVRQVRRIDQANLEIDPPMVDGPRRDYVSSIARPDGGDSVFMLNLEIILEERMS